MSIGTPSALAVAYCYWATFMRQAELADAKLVDPMCQMDRLIDGDVVDLQLVDEIVCIDCGDLEDADRAALHRELEASIAEADEGSTEDFAKVLAELATVAERDHRPDGLGRHPGEELQALTGHADHDVLESVDDPPALTVEEDLGVEAAIVSLESGKGRTLEQVQQTLGVILRR